MAEVNAENPSMEDILDTIRGVISGEDENTSQADAKALAQDKAPEKKQEAKPVSEPSQPAQDAAEDDDILELTDIIEEGDAMPEAPVPASDETSSEGLLSDIDNMIGSEEEVAVEEAAAPTPEAAAEPEPQVQPEPESVPEPEPQVQAAEEDVVDVPEATEATVEAVKPAASERLVSDAAVATSQAVLKEMMAAMPRQKVASPATRGGTTLEDLVIEAIRPYLSEWMDKNLATIVKQLVEKEIKHLIPRDVE